MYRIRYNDFLFRLQDLDILCNSVICVQSVDEMLPVVGNVKSGADGVGGDIAPPPPRHPPPAARGGEGGVL
jgi:hypothetical protein